MSNSLRPCGLQPARLLCPWNSPGKSTGVDCHILFQGIFPTQGANPGLLCCRQILTIWATGKPGMRASCLKYTALETSNLSSERRGAQVVRGWFKCLAWFFCVRLMSEPGLGLDSCTYAGWFSFTVSHAPQLEEYFFLVHFSFLSQKEW